MRQGWSVEGRGGDHQLALAAARPAASDAAPRVAPAASSRADSMAAPSALPMSMMKVFRTPVAGTAIVPPRTAIHASWQTGPTGVGYEQFGTDFGTIQKFLFISTFVASANRIRH